MRSPPVIALPIAVVLGIGSGCGAGAPTTTVASSEDDTAPDSAEGAGAAADEDGPVVPTTVARADISGRALVQDGKRLYFAGPPLAESDGSYGGADGDLVWFVRKRGGHPNPLFKNPLGSVSGIAVDRGRVYFTVAGTLVLSAQGGSGSTEYRKGQIMRVAAGGGKPKLLVRNQVEAKAIVADGDKLFWFTDGDGSAGAARVRRAGDKGGNVKALAKGVTAPGALAVHGEHVYWLSTGEDPDAGWSSHLWRTDRDGGDARKLATVAGEPRALACDGESVFVATAEIIARVPREGGEPVQLVDDAGRPQALALDAERLYWTARETGRVSSVPKSGGQITVLAADQKELGGIVVDERAVYWTVKSAVRKVTKPGVQVEAEEAAPPEPEAPADPFAPVAEEEPDEVSPQPTAEADGTALDPEDLPDKWLKCKKHKQCVLLETGCCMMVSVKKKFRKQARKALPRKTCEAECDFDNIGARCEDGQCRAVITP